MENKTKTKLIGSTREMVTCSLFVVLIIVGTYLKIPMPLVPITFQLFFTTLSGALLGSKNGALSVFVYVLMGLIGLPVFTGGGGISYILKPSFGYLIGFILGAYITGKIAENAKPLTYGRALWACFAGLLVVYALGTVYCWVVSNFILATPTAIIPLLVNCVLLPIPGDILLMFLAAKIAVMWRKRGIAETLRSVNSE